jgi:hypothetical protein
MMFRAPRRSPANPALAFLTYDGEHRRFAIGDLLEAFGELQAEQVMPYWGRAPRQERIAL